MTFSIQKRNRRLCVLRDGEVFYAPPDFIRLVNRDQLRMVVTWLNEGIAPIDAVMMFESVMRPAPAVGRRQPG